MEGFLSPKKLNQSILPTRKDVLEFYFFVKTNKPGENIFSYCASEIQNVWANKVLETVTNQRISKKLQDIVKEYQQMLKCSVTRRSPNFLNKCEDFKFHSFTLFDISKSKLELGDQLSKDLHKFLNGAFLSFSEKNNLIS